MNILVATIVALLPLFFPSIVNAEECTLYDYDEVIEVGACVVLGEGSSREQIIFKESYVFVYLFAVSDIDDDNIKAEAWWNNYQNRAHDSLGVLTLAGNCWEGERFKICMRD